jgi:hypothetical protein
MKPEHHEQVISILILCGWLITFMFVALQLLFLTLKQKLFFDLKKTTESLLKMSALFCPTHYPEDFRRAWLL